jgi:hypothetical protein
MKRGNDGGHQRRKAANDGIGINMAAIISGGNIGMASKASKIVAAWRQCQQHRFSETAA